MTHALPRLALLGLSCTSLTLASCVVVTQERPRAAPAPAQPKQPAQGGPLQPHGVNGRPPHLQANAPAAYWIWRSPDGAYHLRTTTAGRRHTFAGQVAASRGAVTNVTSTRVESGDKIQLEDGRVRFELVTDGHVDGFDFTVGDKGCARFDLRLDDQDRPDRIFVGQHEQHPASGRFEVCP